MNDAALTPDRSDRWGMYLTVLLGAAGAVATVWAAVARLVEIASPGGIPVLVPFPGETAPLPIGPGGAPVEVDVDQAVVTVTDPAPATLFALIAEPIVSGGAIVAGIVLLCLFCLAVARGRAFARGTVRLVTAGAFVLLGGWGLSSLFRTMGVNGALAAVSDHSYDGVLFQTDFSPFFVALGIAAVGVAFQIGHKLQRETEGLV